MRSVSVRIRWKTWAVSILLLTGLVACSTPDVTKPADLGPNLALLGVKRVWNAAIGPVNFPLEVNVKGSQIYVASSGGTVAAIDSRTGGDVWRLALNTPLSAGVGSDGRYAAVVSRGNELITIDAGHEVWRQKLNALTLTAPLVAGERVFVLGADRSVAAFDVATGRKLWQQQRSAESLSLGQAGVLLPVGDTLVVGLGGHLLGLNPSNGNTVWDASVANSRGTNEVERLVDLVAGVSRAGDQLCVRAFQSAVGCTSIASGKAIWSKTAAGSTGIAGDSANLYGTESDGRLVAWKRSDGERLWVSERLRFRTLSAPVVAGRSLVLGDNSGTLHFLLREDGSPLNRMPTDGSPIAVTPVLVGSTLVAVTQRGGVFGYRPQ